MPDHRSGTGPHPMSVAKATAVLRTAEAPPADRCPCSVSVSCWIGIKPPAWTGAVGVDRNVGQATDSDNEVPAVPDAPKLEAKIKRKQRARSRKQGWGPKARRPKSHRGRRVGGQLKKLNRKRKRRRGNAARQHSRRMADTAHTVVLEDLDTQAMTRSAGGAVEHPGTNVQAKSGLDRGILASNRGRLERMLDYKAGQVVRVAPAYTSQTCAVCGHVDEANRRTRTHFHCTHAACGHTANADRNAALNILERGLALLPKARGMGASARREGLGPCPLPAAMVQSTSPTREQGRPSLPRGVSSLVHGYASPQTWQDGRGFRSAPPAGLRLPCARGAGVDQRSSPGSCPEPRVGWVAVCATAGGEIPTRSGWYEPNPSPCPIIWAMPCVLPAPAPEGIMNATPDPNAFHVGGLLETLADLPPWLLPGGAALVIVGTVRGGHRTRKRRRA